MASMCLPVGLYNPEDRTDDDAMPNWWIRADVDETHLHVEGSLAVRQRFHAASNTWNSEISRL